MDRDRAIAAIVDEARKTRRRPSRALWIAALLVGVACAIAFVMLMLADEAPSPVAKPTAESGSQGRGFTAGLVVGGVLGIAVGFAIARQRHSSRNSP